MRIFEVGGDDGESNKAGRGRRSAIVEAGGGTIAEAQTPARSNSARLDIRDSRVIRPKRSCHYNHTTYSHVNPSADQGHHRDTCSYGIK